MRNTGKLLNNPQYCNRHCRPLFSSQICKEYVHRRLKVCLHEDGGPQAGEVTCGGLPHLTCKRHHIKMGDYMDRQVTPAKRVTSPIWGTPPPCKQTLRKMSLKFFRYKINEVK